MSEMFEFADEEKREIEQWARALDEEVILRYATTGHSADGGFNAYIDRFSELAPDVRKKKDGDAVVERPTLFVNNRIAYQALPADRELPPFLQYLKQPDRFAEQIPAGVCHKLTQLQLPALVKVYITPHCPFCPATVSMLLGLSANSDQIRLTVIDGELFADAAQKDRVTAAPTVILDDQFRWTGSIDADELVSMMLDRDPANLGAEALRGMIEEGDAEGVAVMMQQRGKIFSGFLALLAHPRWSVRLGAMVVFETLMEMDPHLAGRIVDPVIALFTDVDDMTKGDLLHVLGESGNGAVVSFLHEVLQEAEDEEVRAAAVEAIEKLTQE